MSLIRHINKFYGKYRGQVVSINDIEQRGRIEVIVPSILKPSKVKRSPNGDVIPFSIEDFPTIWCEPALPPGYFCLPKIGDGVWVEFEGGELSFPIWTGVWNTFLGEKDVHQEIKNIIYSNLSQDKLNPNTIIIDNQGNLWYNVGKVFENLTGIITANSVCPFTGNKHIDYSKNVRMKGGSL